MPFYASPVEDRIHVHQRTYSYSTSMKPDAPDWDVGFRIRGILFERQDDRVRVLEAYIGGSPNLLAEPGAGMVVSPKLRVFPVLLAPNRLTVILSSEDKTLFPDRIELNLERIERTR